MKPIKEELIDNIILQDLYNNLRHYINQSTRVYIDHNIPTEDIYDLKNILKFQVEEHYNETGGSA